MKVLLLRKVENLVAKETKRNPILQEVYGEDPHLTGRLAEAYILGLQGDDDRYIQAASSCKAFLGYAGPENLPVSRLTFDAKVHYYTVLDF